MTIQQETTQPGALLVRPLSLPGQQHFGDSVVGSTFPLVLECGNSAASQSDVWEWVADHRDELQRKAREHGAILFRGFPLQTAEDFDQFVASFQFANFPYLESLSNAIRINYTPRVFSANEAPSEVSIYLHHEMAQTPIFPGKLFFFCLQPAEFGGATPLCRSDVLYSAIETKLPEFAHRCEQLGLHYTSVMPSSNDASSGMGRSWQSTLAAEDQAAAEARLQSLGYHWEWLPDGCLRATTPLLPAVREVAPGRKTFFNQLIAAFRGWKDSRNDPSKSITWGDGTALDPSEVLQVAEMAEELTFDIPWQAGDVALVDNFVVMHGRRTFQGKRKVLASLADAQTHTS